MVEDFGYCALLRFASIDFDLLCFTLLRFAPLSFALLPFDLLWFLCFALLRFASFCFVCFALLCFALLCFASTLICFDSLRFVSRRFASICFDLLCFLRSHLLRFTSLCFALLCFARLIDWYKHYRSTKAVKAENELNWHRKRKCPETWPVLAGNTKAPCRQRIKDCRCRCVVHFVFHAGWTKGWGYISMNLEQYQNLY